VFGREGAPTIVLAHAWMCSLELWRGQIEDLMGDFRVAAYDHRGHGRSEPARSGDYSIETLGADLGAVVATCVPEGERAVVAGHSTGAMSLVAWAGEEPDEVRRRVSAAALINTGMSGLIAGSTLLGPPQRLGRRRELVGRSVMGSRARFGARPARVVHRVVRRVAMGPAASAADVALVARLAAACPPDVRAAFGLTLAGLDIDDAVQSLTVPTLVIAGGSDRLTPPSHSERLAEALPEPVELTELPGVGHMAPVEAREEITRALRKLRERN
jgi:pimeloyl-ACP methyl ester carboxylesterase